MHINFPLLFFLFLIPLSGFIAWAGDRIGHRIGKRRHTILGLRPRHTAMITTVAAGMVISLVSFGLMWASNATFRDLLQNGEMLLHSLKQQNHALRGAVAQQKRLVEQQAEESESLRQQAELRLVARDLATKAQHAAQTDLQKAQAGLIQARHDQKLLLERQRAVLRQSRADLSQTRTQLLAKEARLALAQKNVRVAEDRLHRATAAARDAQKRVANAQRDFGAVTERFKEVMARLKAEAAQQQAQGDRQRAELENGNRDLEAKRLELSALEDKRADLDAKLGLSLTRTTAFRRNKIIYQVDEEVERVAFASTMTATELQIGLWRLLARAADKAKARGAVAPPDGRAVVILPKPVRAASGAVPGRAAHPLAPKILDEADSVAAAADAIRRAGEEAVVLLVASANAVAGEPVAVEFRTYRNRRVLRRGTVVGTITLDGTRPQPDVAHTLYNFLRRDVRKRLLQSGVIPFGESGAGFRSLEESVVSIPGDRWFGLLDEVRRAGASAQVVVRAASDLRSADPVALVFEVNRARDVSLARP